MKTKITLILIIITILTLTTIPLATADGTFTDLQTDITAATGTITLTQNYTNTESLTTPITITKDLIIDGVGFTLDAKHFTNIFTINTGFTITLKNLILINGNSSEGGAVYSTGNLIIENSTFINNTATSNSNQGSGGAIKNDGGTLSVKSSTFINNTATASHGGAINSRVGNLTVEKSSFDNNTASLNGGAINTNGIGYTSSIIDSNFTNNKQTTSSNGGGAVKHNGGTLNINNTRFVNNTAVDEGGAIMTGSESDMVLNINNTVFVNNTANDGGAVSSIMAVNISSSVIYNNSPTQVDVGSGSTLDYNWWGVNNPTTTDTNGLPNNHLKLIVEIDRNQIFAINDNSLVNMSLVANDSSTIPYTYFPETVLILSPNNGEINPNMVTLNSTLDAEAQFTFLTNNNAAITVVLDGESVTTAWSQGTIQSFTTLKELIDSTTGDTLDLNNGYAYNATLDSALVDGIPINKNLIINGNGAILDAKKLANIFTIESDVTVTLRNISFINSKGAIFNNGILIVDNSSFLHNNRSGNGGAIFTNGNLSVNNSYFEDNRALSNNNNGGAIATGTSATNNMIIDNSIFYKNRAFSFGGAIFNQMKLTIINSNFTSNTATQGAAIHVGDATHGDINRNSPVNITNTVFINNYGAKYGGAIRSYADLNITNGTFIGNHLNNEAAARGGAINLVGDTSSYSPVSYIVDCLFEDNTAGDSGGAIRSSALIYVYNTIFNNNKLSSTNPLNGSAFFNNALKTVDSYFFNVTFMNHHADWGGAIFNIGGSINLNDTHFINNTASIVGGAIYTEPANNVGRGIILSNSEFINNSAGTGGAIFNLHSLVNLTNVYFENNTAIQNNTAIPIDTPVSGNGGAIYNEGTLYGYNATFFLSESTYHGGAIVNIGNSSFYNSNFTSSKSAHGGAFYNRGGHILFNSTIFTNNIATENGGALYNNASTGSFNAIVDNCIFTNNTATTGTGGAIRNYFNDLIILNSVFNLNTALNNYAGALGNMNGTVTISNTTFGNNTAACAGAIGNGGTLLINSNSQFINNTAKTSAGFPADGGAIGNDGNISINDTLFDNNHADASGGAIFNRDGEFILNRTIFTDNNAIINGGAIFNNGTGAELLHIDESQFLRNSVSSQDGGAISNEDTILYIYDTLFENNTANKNAGALSNRGIIHLNNTIFNCNIANNVGGAIATSDDVFLNNGIFFNNSAKSGGAIFTVGNVYDNQSRFDNNNATYGAVLCSHNAGDIAFETISSSSNFTNNYADNGGVIYNNGSALSLTDAIFLNNTAIRGGILFNAAKFIINGTATSELVNNIAIYGGLIYNINEVDIQNTAIANLVADYGGFIYNNATDAIVKIQNTTLFNNTANHDGGVIYNENGILNITESNIFNNTAGADGGAIYSTSLQNSVINLNRIVDNNATNNGKDIYGTSSVNLDNNWWGLNNPTTDPDNLYWTTWNLRTNTATISSNINMDLAATWTGANNLNLEAITTLAPTTGTDTFNIKISDNYKVNGTTTTTTPTILNNGVSTLSLTSLPLVTTSLASTVDYQTLTNDFILVENITINDITITEGTTTITLNGTYTSTSDLTGASLSVRIAEYPEINATATTGADGKISFTLNGLDTLNPGDYTLEYYHGDVLLNNSKLEVNRIENITSEDKTIIIGNATIDINAIYNSTGAIGFVNLTVNIQDHTGISNNSTTDSNGNIVFRLTGLNTLGVGDYTLNYYHDDILLNSSKLSIIALVENITVNNTQSRYNDTSVTVNGTFTSNNVTEGVTIILKIDDDEYSDVTDEDGKVNFNINKIYSAGNHTISFHHNNNLLNTSNWEILPAETSITISTNTTTINGTLMDTTHNTPISGADIIININSTNHTVTTDSNGKYMFEHNIVHYGTYLTTVTFNNTNYTLSNNTDNVNIPLVENITIDSVNSVYNTTTTFNGNFTSNNLTISEKIIVKVGEDIVAEGTINSDGSVSFTITEIYNTGNYILSFYHNNKLLNTSFWTVSRANSTLTVFANSTLVNGTLVDGNGNPIRNVEVNVTVDGVSSNVTTGSDGKFVLPISVVSAGDHAVSVSFSDVNYNASSASTSFNVALVENVTVGDVDSVYNTTAGFNGVFISNNGTDGIVLNYTVVGTGISGNFTTGADGSFSFAISEVLATGSYTIEYKHGGILLNTSFWTVSRANSTLTVFANSTLVNGTLVDGNGNPIRNVEVNVTVDGVSSNVTTGSDGKFVLPISVVSAGDHAVSVSFSDVNYNASSASTSFNVALVENITANNITSVFNDSSVSVSGVITSNNVTENGTVVVKVDSDSREYSGTISGTGSFTVNIADVYAVGNHTLSFYHNNILLNTSNWDITPAMTNISVSANSTRINGTLTDTSHNTPILGGLVTYNVTDSIGNIIVSGSTSTDSTGKYNVVISITPAGDYTVNVKFQNTNYTETSNSTSFTISLVENITTKDTSAQANATDVQLNATYTSTGIISGVTITVKVKDTNITINTTTDTTGKITFNIPIKNKLDPGNYTIEYYHGTTLLNTSKLTILPYNENITTTNTTAYYDDTNIKINAQYTAGNMQGTIITLKINGQNITTATISADGKLVFNMANKPSLEVGNYTLEYYHGDKLLNTSTLSIKPVTTTVQITTQNNKIIGTLIDTIHKQPIPNTKVYYEIKDAKGNVVEKGTTTTNSQGKFTIPLNPSGTNTGTYIVDILYPGDVDHNSTVKELIVKKNGTSDKNDTKKRKIPMRRTGTPYQLLVLAMLLISIALGTHKRKN